MRPPGTQTTGRRAPPQSERRQAKPRARPMHLQLLQVELGSVKRHAHRALATLERGVEVTSRALDERRLSEALTTYAEAVVMTNSDVDRMQRGLHHRIGGGNGLKPRRRLILAADATGDADAFGFGRQRVWYQTGFCPVSETCGGEPNAPTKVDALGTGYQWGGWRCARISR